MMTNELSIFDRPIEVPEELRRATEEKGWPPGMLQRALELHIAHGALKEWLANERFTVDDIARFVEWRHRLISGTIRVREATWSDDEALADLYANSPEEIGEWEVTVERSPYPFAQFRLQENPNIQVIEDRGIILAAAAHSGRNTIVGGKRTSTHIASAWRVRKECRGQGMSNLLRMGSGNYDAVGWIKALRPDIERDEQGDLPGILVTVTHFRAQPFDGDATGIRNVRRAETRQCVALINRTHRGLDFFRPYTKELLHQHLDDPMWGDKPSFWAEVYRWHDYYLLEEQGRIVACAGLWDRGRHMREVWVHKETGERQVIEPTALMDFGYAEGREDAMARLLAYLIGRTHDLGRQELMVPLDQLPAGAHGVVRADERDAQHGHRRLPGHEHTAHRNGAEAVHGPGVLVTTWRRSITTHRPATSDQRPDHDLVVQPIRSPTARRRTGAGAARLPAHLRVHGAVPARDRAGHRIRDGELAPRRPPAVGDQVHHRRRP
jgi:hypothetical protein